MRYIKERIWSDGARHWYDAPTRGYYMDEGAPGLYRDDGTLIREGVRVTSKGEFESLIVGLVLLNPANLP